MAEEREIQEVPYEGWRQKDNPILLAVGVEPAEGEMWQKEGVLL